MSAPRYPADASFPHHACSGALTGSQRAAVVLAQLDADRARRVLQAMTESEVVELTSALASLPVLHPDEVHHILAQFCEELGTHAAVAQGGVDAARELLRDRLGAARADEILLQVQGAAVNHPLSFLHRVDPHEIAICVRDEHPQLIAVVLCQLSPDHGARVLALLDPDLRLDVVQRVATTGALPPETVGHIAAVLEQRLSALLLSGMGGASSAGGIGTVVALLNSAEQADERQVLIGLDDRDPELAEEIRNQMFLFDDVIGLDDRSMQLVLRQVPLSELAVALKGVPDEVRDRIRANLSERAASDLLDEIEYLGPVRVSAVEAAQRAVVRLVRDLDANGDIVLARSNDGIVV